MLIQCTYLFKVKLCRLLSKRYGGWKVGGRRNRCCIEFKCCIQYYRFNCETLKASPFYMSYRSRSLIFFVVVEVTALVRLRIDREPYLQVVQHFLMSFFVADFDKCAAERVAHFLQQLRVEVAPTVHPFGRSTEASLARVAMDKLEFSPHDDA